MSGNGVIIVHHIRERKTETFADPDQHCPMCGAFALHGITRALRGTFQMKALVLASLVACADQPPAVTFALDVSDPTLDAELDRALVGWASIGMVRDDAKPDIAAYRVEFVPDDSIPVDGRTLRFERRIMIRESVTGFRLLVVLAHEIGHGVLDTFMHTSCGIMGGSDFFPCDEDIALACDRLDGRAWGCP